MSDPLTHFDEAGAAKMVEVGAKPETARSAEAQARVRMHADTLARIEAGKVGKGDVFGVARIAGIQAAKQTAGLIPLCHPVRLTGVELGFDVDPGGCAVLVRAHVLAHDRTGPEMEAMSAATVAALAIYDMCKAMDRGITIEEVRLLSKSGGKSGTWTAGD